MNTPHPPEAHSLTGRRQFLRNTGIALAGLGLAPALLRAAPEAAPGTPRPPQTGDARAYWIAVASRIARPVLENLAARTLKKNMPVEQRGKSGREKVTHLEAFGRLMAGIAPWLEQDRPEPWLKLAREAIDAATDPGSPDFMNFTTGGQPLVDAAFLALAFLRAPKSLWEPLPDKVKANVIAALKSSRAIKPGENNWLLFAASVEAALHRMGEPVNRERVAYALKRHQEWYLGDGTYGDGPHLHWDYYNSYVIHPMLVEVTDAFSGDGEWGPLARVMLKRASRYAAIQERMISPEGTFPILGRSSAYRFGAFQTLAQIALRGQLPKEISPAQVRCALTAVIRRQIEAPGTFDADGWLRIGFCGAQPNLAEGYISTGSLYLCSVALLPLGLPASDPFWSAPDAPWTAVKAWGGVDLPADHAS